MHDRVRTADATLLGTIATLDRHALEEWIEAAIARLDSLDCDPDLEEDDAPEEDDHDGGEHDGREPEDWTLPDLTDPAARRMHRDRIRAHRCFPVEERWRDRGAVHVRVVRHELMHDPRVPSRRRLLTRRRGMPRQVRP